LDPDLEPNPLVRGTDTEIRVRIRTKTSPKSAELRNRDFLSYLGSLNPDSHAKELEELLQILLRIKGNRLKVKIKKFLASFLNKPPLPLD
jgi:hypothetical protein